MAPIKNISMNKEASDRERKNFAILDTIRKKGPVGRTEISKLTGFNIVTVSNYIDGYIKDGLVFEEGYDSSSGGRKPMLVNLRQKSGYVIGVGFDMTDMIGVLTDLKGEIVFQVKKKHLVETGAALVQKLIDTADEVMAKASVEKNRIRGIGLAVSGIVDRENHTIRWPGPLGTPDAMISLFLEGKLTNHFDAPLIVENDADCAAFGEQWLTLDPDYKDVVYMFSGVSCGIMVNGRVYDGASGFAGELGILNQDALGQYDCKKESYGLGRWDMELGILQDIKELQNKNRDSQIFKLANGKIENVSFLTVVEAANAKDKFAVDLLTDAGRNLGKKVAFLVNLLNPQAVVIGGGIERAGSILMDPLKKTVKEWAFEEATRGLKIIPAQLAENAVSLGAASLAIRNYFEQM